MICLHVNANNELSRHVNKCKDTNSTLAGNLSVVLLEPNPKPEKTSPGHLPMHHDFPSILHSCNAKLISTHPSALSFSEICCLLFTPCVPAALSRQKAALAKSRLLPCSPPVLPPAERLSLEVFLPLRHQRSRG